MGKRQLRIIVAEDGSVSVKVEGVAGSSCLGESRFLEEAMGGGITVREETAEMYETEVSAEEKVGQG